MASYYKQLYIYFENEKSKRLLASFGNTRFFGSLRPSCLDFAFENKYIIAEEISDNASFRKSIRNNTYNFGTIKSKLKKNAKDDNKIYDMYYDYEEKIKHIKPHRISMPKWH